MIKFYLKKIIKFAKENTFEALVLITIIYIIFKPIVFNARAIVEDCVNDKKFPNRAPYGINCEIGYSEKDYNGGGYIDTFDFADDGEFYLNVQSQDLYEYSIYGSISNHFDIKIFINGFEVKNINKSKSYYKLYEKIL